MRVAVIAPPWLPVPPVAYGGTELVLDTLCRGLAQQGHEVLLVATGDSSCPVPTAWVYDEHLGVANASPARELHHVIGAYQLIEEWGADVVHDHTITGPAWAAGRLDAPVITTNHGPFEGELLGIYRQLSDRVPVIAISEHQASTATGLDLAGVIHHGLDLAPIPVGAGRGGYALFLGRMSPTKGVHRAIRIAREAGVPLRIAAKLNEPDEHAYFEGEVEPLLGGDVEYVGEVAGDTKQELLRDAVCLLNPIAWPEPFGMVMIEALAAGTPVVTTPCGAAPEIVEDGVTGAVCADTASLVRAVEQIERIDRVACRQSAEQRFSMSRMAAHHVELFSRFVTRPADRPVPAGVLQSTAA